MARRGCGGGGIVPDNVFDLWRIHLYDQRPGDLGPCGKCPSLERLHYTADPGQMVGKVYVVLGRLNCAESELCDDCAALVAALRDWAS